MKPAFTWILLGTLLISGAQAGALGGVDIGIPDLRAGATNTVYVNFTIATVLNATDNINVTFDSDFDISGATNPDCGNTLDGTLTIPGGNITATTLTIDRGAGATNNGTEAIACTIDGIVNPGVSGAVGAYTVTTFNTTSNTEIDTGAHAGDTILVHPFDAGPTIETNTTAAGATARIWINFTSNNTIPDDGYLNVTFPAGYTVGDASDGACTTDDDTILTTAPGGNNVRLEFDTNGEAAGAEVCFVDGIVNPTTPGATGDFEVRTTNSAEAAIDEDTTVTGLTITAASLTDTNVQPASLLRGTTNNVTITFTTTNPIPADGKVYVEFGSEFNITDAAEGWCSFTGVAKGGFATSTDGDSVVITRDGTGAASIAGTAETCYVEGIDNPSDAGSTGTYQINTTTTGDVIIDQDSAVSADTITAPSSGGGGYVSPQSPEGPGVPITADDVQADSDEPGATGTWRFDYVLGDSMRGRTYVEARFPSGFSLEQETSTTCVIEAPTGIQVEDHTYPDDHTVRCDLGIIPESEEGDTIRISITEVTNPNSATSGTIDVAFLDYNLVDIHLGEYPFTIEGSSEPEDQDGATTDGEDGTDGADGDAGSDAGTDGTTIGEDEDDTPEDPEQDTPGLAFVSVLLVLSLAVVRRRL